MTDRQHGRTYHDWRTDVLRLLECVEGYLHQRDMNSVFRARVSAYRARLGERLLKETFESETIKQTDADIQSGYEGAELNCPVCQNNPESDYTPIILLKQGKCYECETEFSVEVTWHVGDNDD